MKVTKQILLGAVCIVCIFLIVTLTIKNQDKPIILGTNPKMILEGEKFNEIEGQSTLGISGRNFTKYDIIYVNDIEQPTTVDEAMNIATCFVDENMVSIDSKKLTVQLKRVVNGEIIEESNKYNIKIKTKR